MNEVDEFFDYLLAMCPNVDEEILNKTEEEIEDGSA